MFDSLKRRLVLLSVGALSCVWIATLLLSYHDAREEIDTLFDAHLAQAASLLVAQTDTELEEVSAEHAPSLHKYDRSVAFQIWIGGTTLGLHSANAPNEVLGSSHEGFSERMIGSTPWRVYSTWDREHEYLVHVGEKIELREKLLREMLESLLMPMLWALPVLGLALWIVVHAGLRPLRRLAQEIGDRHPDRLDAVDSKGIPAEVRPLVQRLNDLLGRVGRSLDNTRRFTADAAHELRTPLAAIRAQAQVAQGAESDASRRQALDSVIAGSDQASHLIEQLLTLARLDSQSLELSTPIPLRAIATELIADLAPNALTRGVELVLADGDEIHAPAQSGLLRILLRNLVDNAVRYSDAGGEVVISLRTSGVDAIIEVADSGPGIPPEALTRIFDRFYRVAGSDEEGSGLGLSIVKRIAEMHKGAVSIANRESGTGLVARVSLPLATH